MDSYSPSLHLICMFSYLTKIHMKFLPRTIHHVYFQHPKILVLHHHHMHLPHHHLPPTQVHPSTRETQCINHPTFLPKPQTNIYAKPRGEKCNKCQQFGHTSSDCLKVNGYISGNTLDMNDEINEEDIADEIHSAYGDSFDG